jgi:hypothetical protein
MNPGYPGKKSARGGGATNRSFQPLTLASCGNLALVACSDGKPDSTFPENVLNAIRVAGDIIGNEQKSEMKTKTRRK